MTMYIVRVHEDLFKCMITSRLIVPGIKNVSDGVCGENQDPCFMFNNIFPQMVSFMI